jgi:type II secretory pathway component HofQ
VQEIFDHQSTAEPASNYVLKNMENYEKYKHVNMIELFYDTVNERMRKEQEEAKKNAAEDKARREQYHANQKRKREDLEEESDEDFDEDSDEETDDD